MMLTEELLARFDPATGDIAGGRAVVRHLSDLRGCFADATAYDLALAAGNPQLYRVCTVEPRQGD